MSNLTINPGVTSSLCEIMRRPAFPTTRLTIGKLLDVNNNAFASLHQSLQQLQNQSQLNELTHSLSQNHCHQQQVVSSAKSAHTGGRDSASGGHKSNSGKGNNSNCNGSTGTTGGNSENGCRREKRRYSCSKCPYATDRRDLFTRHENIHRDEKPFRCYVCNKMFNRADHVKKHFLRIHKGLEYDVKLTKRIKGIDYDTNENSPSSIHVNVGNLSTLLRDHVTNESTVLSNKLEELIATSGSTSAVISTRNNLPATASGSNCKSQLSKSVPGLNVNSLYTHELVSHILDQQQQQQQQQQQKKKQQQGYLSPEEESESAMVQRLNEWTSAAAAVGCMLSDREEGEVVSVNPRMASGHSGGSFSSCDVQAAVVKEKGGRGLHGASGELEEGRSKIRCTGAYEVDSPESFCLLSPVNSPCDSADSSSSSSSTSSTSSPSSPSSPRSLSPSSPSSPPSTSASSCTSQDARVAVEDKKSIIVPPPTTSSCSSGSRSSSCSISRSTSPPGPTSNAPLSSSAAPSLPLHSSTLSSPLSSLRSLPPPLAPPPPPPPPPLAASTAAGASLPSLPPPPPASFSPPPPPPAPYAASTALLSSSKGNSPNGTALTPNSSCNYDSSLSSSSNTLRVNLAAKLNAKSNYECEECGCNFVDYASLHTHRYLLHEYICHSSNCLPYTCVVCGVKTQTQRSMIQHMTIHSFIGRKINSAAAATAAATHTVTSSTSSSSFSSLPSTGTETVRTGAKTSSSLPAHGKKRKRLLLDLADMVKLKNQNKSSSPLSPTLDPGEPYDGPFYCVTESDHPFSHSSSTRRKQLLPRKILKTNHSLSLSSSSSSKY